MSFAYEQLPLAFQRQHHATLDSFVAGDNSAVVHAVQQLVNGDERYLYLFGAAGSGRSHLLQAACHSADQRGMGAVYLPLAELRDYTAATLFEGLDTLDLVCLDDIDTVLGQRDGEQALFSLYNALADSGTRLLVSASMAVRELDIALEDLRSRLSWGAVFQLRPLTEIQQQQVIRDRARCQGLDLGDDALQFISQRCQRDMQSLLAVLDQLDRASLREQRRLTIPFIKATLGW